MRMCDVHYQELRKAIDDRGLTHLCRSNQENYNQTLLELKQVSDPTDHKHFDPLHSAVWGIYSNALKSGGLYLMSEENICPLCELEAHTTEKAATWIQNCTDSILLYARQQFLVPAVQ